MDRTSSLRLRTALAAALVALLTLTACQSDDDAGGGKAGDQDVAIGGANFSTADQATAKLGSDAKPGVFPRTVKHASGTTEIKTKPSRVVVLDTGELDDVLSLGIQPVGLATTEGADAVPAYLAPRVTGVKRIGTINDLNLEAIAALKPDLILGSRLRAEKVYPQLAKIAPTVFSIRPGFPWKENLLLVGDSVGEETKALAQLNTYQRSVNALSTKAPNGTTVSLVRFMPGKIRLYGNKSLIGVILKDAKLARPKVQDVDDLAVQISAEEIAKADGSALFYTSYGTPAATGETSIINGSAWKSLPPVKAGNAFRVDDGVWFLGLGPIGAGLIVKDLSTYLSKL